MSCPKHMFDHYMPIISDPILILKYFTKVSAKMSAALAFVGYNLLHRHLETTKRRFFFLESSNFTVCVDAGIS